MSATLIRLGGAFFAVCAVVLFAPVVHLAPQAATAATVTPPPGAAQREQAYADHAGTGADCTVYADDLYQRLTAAGVTAREVNVYASSLNSFDAHTFVEVKVARGWEIQDPTFDGWWSIGGHAASALDIQNALEEGRESAVVWHGPAEPLVDYYVNPLLLFRIVQYVEPDSHGNLRDVGSRTIPLDDVYYGRAHIDGPTASVVVVTGGSDWTIGPYALAQAPDGRWISPIIFASGLTLAGVGAGQETILQVPRFPLAQVAEPGPRSAERED